MNTIADWLNHPQVVRLGWTLVHFVWEATLWAGAWAAVRAGLGGRSPQSRYVAGCVVLLLMAASPVVTWVSLEPPPGSSAPGTGAIATLNAVTTAVGSADGSAWSSPLDTRSAAWVDSLSRGADAAMPWVVGVWLTGVLAMCLRLTAGWHRVTRLRRQGLAVAEAWLLERLECLRQRMGLSRPVQLLQSAWIEVPTVAGWLRPVILLPLSSLSGLSPKQFELLLAHELAHIRRHDHWVNLVQVLIETVLFYHPAVWWVSRAVREEREHCCDDLAVEACGDRIAYVEALASMEALRQLAPQLAMGAAGGSLLGRVRRLLGLGAVERNRRKNVGGALLLVAFVAITLAGVGWAISPPRYEAVARLMIDSPEEEWPAVPGGWRAPSPEYMANQLEWLHSRTLLETVIKKQRLNERWPALLGRGTSPPSDLPRALLSRITVRRVPPSGLIEVIVTAREPGIAADTANTLVQEFVEQSTVQRQKRTLDGLFFLKGQASGLEQDVQKARVDLQEYRAKSGFVSFSEEHNNIAQALGAATVDLTEARSKAETAKSTLEQLRRHVAEGNTLATFPPVAADPQLRQVQLDLVRLEIELSALLSAQGEGNPSVQQARARIEATRAAADRLMQSAAATLEAEAKLAMATEEAQASVVKQWEQRQTEWIRAKNQYDVLETKASSSKALFDRVLERAKEVELVRRDRANNIRLVDHAVPPAVAVYPLRKPALILLGFGLFTGLLGLGLVRDPVGHSEAVLNPA